MMKGDSCKLNLCDHISIGWNIFHKPLKKLVTDQTSPLEENPNSKTAEASNIKDTILFNNNLYDEMKYHWIDYSHDLSMRQIRFTFPSQSNDNYEF